MYATEKRDRDADKKKVEAEDPTDTDTAPQITEASETKKDQWWNKKGSSSDWPAEYKIKDLPARN